MAGRGELQIGILIETMRREGYEFAVSRPEIIMREVDGKACEPVEDVVVEVPEASPGAVLEKLPARKGRARRRWRSAARRSVLQFVVPSRGLFGYRSEFLTDTRGEGVLHRTVRGYEPFAGDLPTRSVGAIVSSEAGETTAYALFHIQERATLFVGAGVPVYEGQIVGENRRAGRHERERRAGQEAHQHPRGREGREHRALTPPRRGHDRVGARVDRRRRAARGDAASRCGCASAS